MYVEVTDKKTRGRKPKLNLEQVLEIRCKFLSKVSRKELAEQYAVNPATIDAAVEYRGSYGKGVYVQQPSSIVPEEATTIAPEEVLTVTFPETAVDLEETEEEPEAVEEPGSVEDFDDVTEEEAEEEFLDEDGIAL
jgi:hypothetical protein